MRLEDLRFCRFFPLPSLVRTPNQTGMLQGRPPIVVSQRANDRPMSKQLRPSTALFGAVLICFCGHNSSGHKSTTPSDAMLPTVNGAPFTSGPVTVDSAHCGWNYVLGGGAFYSAVVPSASGFPVGCRITITNADPLPTGSNATGAKWVTSGGIQGCQVTDWERHLSLSATNHGLDRGHFR